MAIPRSGEIQHLALNFSKQQIGNMVLQGMITPDVGTLAISRQEKMQTPPAVAPTETVAAQKINPNAGNPGIAGLESAPPQVVQALQSLPPQGGQAPEAPPVQMAEGGLTELPIRDDMFDEQSYAGGGIVAFAKGGRTDPSLYDPTYYNNPSAALAPVPGELSLEDAAGRMRRAQEYFGFDPTLLDRLATEQKGISEKDMVDLDKMNQVRMLNAAARGMLKPGGFLRGATEAVVGAGEEGAAGMRAKKDLERLNRQLEVAIMKEKNALARGDAGAAQKAIEDRENIRFQMEGKNAELETTMRAAVVKANATRRGDKRDLYNKARDNAQNAMRDQYKGGLAAAPFFGDEAKWNAELNKKVNKELGFLAAEYGIEPSELTPFSMPSLDASKGSSGSKPAVNPAAEGPIKGAAAVTKVAPTQADIDFVTANPQYAAQFTQKFGIKPPSAVSQIPR
jgi:hypothetical protein